MDVKVETKAISNLVNEFVDNNIQLNTSSQSIDQTAKIMCDNDLFNKIKQCDGDSCIKKTREDAEEWIRERKKKRQVFWKYGKYKIKSYGCCPSVSQTGVLEHVSSNSVTKRKLNKLLMMLKRKWNQF